uniref:Uncharacterized protein n=1 Tax=Setaria italica TaxID=4555 RepID=K3ZB82_SETIT
MALTQASRASETPRKQINKPRKKTESGKESGNEDQVVKRMLAPFQNQELIRQQGSEFTGAEEHLETKSKPQGPRTTHGENSRGREERGD